MLQSLSINNFILIDKFNCQFDKGMTTITGESGHGKSIILDALSLLLGARCTQEYFRGEEKISLAAEFNILDNNAATDYLVEQGFDEDGACIIRRVITKEGSSKSFINSAPCTLSDLKKLGKLLIDIHTQNKNSEIFSPESQMEVIDGFGKNNENILKLKEIYSEYVKKEKILRELVSTNASDQSRLELLNYKFKELKELDLKEHEIGELESEYKMLTSAEESITSCENAQMLCSDDDTSIVSLLKKIKNEISGLPLYESNQSISEMINDIEINANELFSTLGIEKSSYNIDEERHSEVKSRLDKIYDIAHRNHTFPEKLFEVYQEIKNEIEGLDVSDCELEERHEELRILKEKWFEIADKVHKNRKNCIEKFSKEVTDCLNELNMPNSLFRVSLREKQSKNLSIDGYDEIEFLMSSNMGQKMQPISSVASGGEVSRLNLAIQSLSSDNAKAPTIVFDEVDTGVGGLTGIVFGKYLNKISRHKQVICITHLAQVMVYGNNYITAKKISNSNSTISKIEYISDHELVNEVARMVGNDIIDGAAIEQAKKMINKAKEYNEL